MQKERRPSTHNPELGRLHSVVPYDTAPDSLYDGVLELLSRPEIQSLDTRLQQNVLELKKARTDFTLFQNASMQQAERLRIEITTTEQELKRWIPNHPFDIPHASDRQGLREEIRYLLGSIGPQHPWFLRLLAKRLGVNEHPEATRKRAAFQNLSAELARVEAKTNEEQKNSSEVVKGLNEGIQMIEDELHDELRPFFAETQEGTIWYAKTYPDRAEGVIQEYTQNALDDLKPDDLFRYFLWTVDQIMPQSWNQHVRRAYANYLEPLFPGLVEDDVFEWHKVGGLPSVTTLLDNFFARRALEREGLSDTNPLHREYRIDYSAFLAWDVIQGIPAAPLSLTRTFPLPKPWFLIFQRQSAAVSPGESMENVAEAEGGETSHNLLLLHGQPEPIEVLSAAQCEEVIRAFIPRQSQEDCRKLGHALFSLIRGCHRPYPGLAPLRDLGLRSRSGATHRVTNRLLRRMNLRILCRIESGTANTRLFEILTISPRDHVYR